MLAGSMLVSGLKPSKQDVRDCPVTDREDCAGPSPVGARPAF